MNGSKFAVIDCGATRAVAARFVSAPGGALTLDQIAVEPIQAEQDEQWPAAAGVAARAAATRAGLSGGVALVLPGHLCLTKFIRPARVDAAKMSKVLLFEAQQAIPYPLAEVVWGHQVMVDEGMDYEVVLAAVKRDVLLPLCRAIQAGGCRIERVQPSFLAQFGAWSYARIQGGEVPARVVLAGIGAKSTNLLFVDGERIFARNVPLAGAALTQALADELNAEPLAAERIKLGPTPEHAPALSAAVRSFVNRLHLEITRSQASMRRQAASTPGAPVEGPARILVFGGGSQAPGLHAALAEKARLPVEAFDPLAGVARSSSVDAATLASASVLLADVVGAAARRTGRGAQGLDLTPADLRSDNTFARRKPILVAAAAVAVASLQFPYQFYAGRVQVEETANQQIRSLTELLQGHSTAIRAQQGRLDEIGAQIGGIQSLVDTRSNWLRFFTDLQGRLTAVENVWLDSLRVERPPVVGGGDAEGGLLGGASVDPEAGAAPPPPVRLRLSGRLLDRDNPLSKVSTAAEDRVKRLLDSFRQSEFISAIEGERFDSSQPGILRFDFVLVVNPNQPL